jgi:very-short-patch-repair endonuclease
MNGLTKRARSLRGNATEAERRLWSGLRRKSVEGFRFRRQVPLGSFIADFACFEAKLIVEVDGATHGADTEITRDRNREKILQDGGFAVLRVNNDDVFNNLDGVLETIRLKLLSRSRS